MITVPSQIRDFAEWHGGCRHALVWALEISSSEVDELLSAARRRLDGLLLPRYERQPHVTSAYAGLEPRQGATPSGHLYPPELLERDLEALRHLIPHRVELSVTGWGSFSMAPYLGVEGTGVTELHEALAAPGERYVPHVTIGLYGVAEHIDLVAERMTGWPAAAVQVEVGAASLLRYETADIAGPLSTVGRLDLTDGTWSV